jgi:hypothetical protein
MTQICLKTNRKFTWRSHDLIIKKWHLTQTMWKPSMSPFRECQVFENLTDSLGLTAYQTRVPSKHRNRGQKRKNRTLTCCHTLKPQFNDGRHIFVFLMQKYIRKMLWQIPPQWGISLLLPPSLVVIIRTTCLQKQSIILLVTHCDA